MSALTTSARRAEIRRREEPPTSTTDQVNKQVDYPVVRWHYFPSTFLISLRHFSHSTTVSEVVTVHCGVHATYVRVNRRENRFNEWDRDAQDVT